MIVGITGHQNLGNHDDISWVKDQLKNKLQQLKIEKAFSSLAIGADQIFAEIILELNIKLEAIIPAKKYYQTFEGKNLEKYNALLERVSNKILLEFDLPNEIAFFEAGKKIAEDSDLLFAVWNGKPAKGLGGTADIVNYMKKLNKPIYHFNPLNKTFNII